MKRRQRGLTLIELLIATAVFAMVGVMVYAALFSVLDSREATDRQARRLAAVQYAVTRLTDDLRQVVDRPVRSQVPTEGAPLFTPTDGVRVLTLTRGGRPNPADQLRSSLARVHWVLDEDDRLLRAVGVHADALPGESPQRRLVLDEIDSIEFRFLDDGSRWQERWPPLNTGAGVIPLPRAVEVTLDLADWGEIVRLVQVTGGVPTAAPGGG
ncbi:MAG: type II secretion system minor pseudopilin GspJ [Halofilum sp. (in: g-proteobacteria)]|nr:type II secretion system minor pseudopilin GspJ [Halofilum sp. (in: g-proteobacteria)]